MCHCTTLHGTTVHQQGITCDCVHYVVYAALLSSFRKMGAHNFARELCPTTHFSIFVYQLTVDWFDVMGWLAGLFDVALTLLEAWAQQHAVSHTPAEGSNTHIQQVPRWVDALLLCLDMGMQPQPAPQPQPEQSTAAAEAAPSASAPAASEAPAAGQAPSATAPSAAASAAPAPETAGGDKPAAAPATTATQERKEEPPAEKTVEERQQAATQMLRDNIKTMFLPNGLLSQQQLDRAATVCMKLLQHLHAWGSAWKVPTEELQDNDAFARPQPASSTQAVIQVLARVTKSHKVALKVCSPSYTKSLDMHAKYEWCASRFGLHCPYR